MTHMSLRVSVREWSYTWPYNWWRKVSQSACSLIVFAKNVRQGCSATDCRRPLMRSWILLVRMSTRLRGFVARYDVLHCLQPSSFRRPTAFIHLFSCASLSEYCSSPLPLLSSFQKKNSSGPICNALYYLLMTFSVPICRMSNNAVLLWCGPSANLECRSEMCCTRLAGNARPKKSPKLPIWAPSHNFVGLYLRK